MSELETRLDQSKNDADIDKFVATDPSSADHLVAFQTAMPQLVKTFYRQHTQWPFLSPLTPLRPIASSIRLSLSGSVAKMNLLGPSVQPYVANVPSSHQRIPLLAPIAALLKTCKWTTDATLALMAFMAAGSEKWRVESKPTYDFTPMLDIPAPDPQELAKAIELTRKGYILDCQLSVLGIIEVGEGAVLWTRVDRTVTLYSVSEPTHDAEAASRVGVSNDCR